MWWGKAKSFKLLADIYFESGLKNFVLLRLQAISECLLFV